MKLLEILRMCVDRDGRFYGAVGQFANTTDWDPIMRKALADGLITADQDVAVITDLGREYLKQHEAPEYWV
jgi:hypothetical protein